MRRGNVEERCAPASSVAESLSHSLTPRYRAPMCGYCAAIGVILAALAGAGCSSSSSESDTSACWTSGSSCVCGAERPTTAVDFNGTCNESGLGDRAICCQTDSSCYCMPVTCGISAVDGVCLCGVGTLNATLVASCDGTASTCCTQDTGYCYCEDGCQDRYANRVVDSCNLATTAATCDEGETQVSSCE